MWINANKRRHLGNLWGLAQPFNFLSFLHTLYSYIHIIIPSYKFRFSISNGEKCIAGVKPKSSDLFVFDMCYYIPIFILSRLGSFLTDVLLLLILWAITWRAYRPLLVEKFALENFINFNKKCEWRPPLHYFKKNYTHISFWGKRKTLCCY